MSGNGSLRFGPATPGDIASGYAGAFRILNLLIDNLIRAGGSSPYSGPVVLSPNGTLHRIKVANDGSLSTEVVT